MREEESGIIMERGTNDARALVNLVRTRDIFSWSMHAKQPHGGGREERS